MQFDCMCYIVCPQPEQGRVRTDGRRAMATKKREQPLSRDEIRQRIRGARLRATPGRMATYDVLYQAESPLTHGQVVTRLASAGFDRATVYRNLMDLTDAALVARSDLGDHAWRFELADEDGAPGGHAHFVCVACGGVHCLAGVRVSVEAAPGMPRAVASDQVEVQLKGRCDSCS